MNREELLEVLPKLPGKRILVVGDLFLDEYLLGRPTRISREAPVLILEYERRFCLPGGGANPARNLEALGVRTLMAGVVGDDQNGVELRDLLKGSGISIEGVVVDRNRPTTTKTRILAHDGNIIRQQVVRMDRLSRDPLSSAITAALVRHVETSIDEVDGVLISDYRSGVVTDELIAACQELTNKRRKLLTVDSQGALYRFKGFGLVKCNQAEAETALGETLESEGSFASACERLLAELGARVVLITRGANGMSVREAGGSHVHIPVANRSEVFDVTGAGDTAIAVFTVGLVAGTRPVTAAHVANYAAGLVVRKIGNATTTIEELGEAIRTSQFARVDPEQDFLK